MRTSRCTNVCDAISRWPGGSVGRVLGGWRSGRFSEPRRPRLLHERRDRLARVLPRGRLQLQRRLPRARAGRPGTSRISRICDLLWRLRAGAAAAIDRRDRRDPTGPGCADDPLRRLRHRCSGCRGLVPGSDTAPSARRSAGRPHARRRSLQLAASRPPGTADVGRRPPLAISARPGRTSTRCAGSTERRSSATPSPSSGVPAIPEAPLRKAPTLMHRPMGGPACQRVDG